MPTSHKKIWVQWIDSSARSGWVDKPEREWTLKDLVCESVGFILQETDELLVLAQSISPDQVGETLCIPRSQVKKQKWLH